MSADDSDSSSLSSAPEDEVKKLAPIFLKAKKATKQAAPPPATSPPRPKRAPSPPHEIVLADNFDIAFLVMFRSRWSDAFPAKLAHLGPQDIERGVVDSMPSSQVENLLCALLGLVLNRKKPVERGHHGRALEEAVTTQKAQWPLRWQSVNPLHGGNDFNNMSPSQRLDLLRTLAMWSLSSSEVIQSLLKESYKQQRHTDDENQSRAVQPWGMDGDKRRYFLVEGQDDTAFRVYRESGRHTKTQHQWISVAGNIEEVKTFAAKLESKEYDGSQAARRLAGRMLAAVPRFEATEEKRKRREYRQIKRQMFSRPEPGAGLYEGRTRGNRIRYNYDDMDDTMDDSDAASFGVRRSVRHTGSARTTPAAEAPTYTASGRQVKPRQGGEYGASSLSRQVQSASPITSDLAGDGYDDTREASEDSEPVRAGGRPTRSGGTSVLAGGAKRKRSEADEESSSKKRRRALDDVDDSMDEMSDDDSAGDWDSDANSDADDDLPTAKDSEYNSDDEDAEPKSLVVMLRVPESSVRSSSPQTAPLRDGTGKETGPVEGNENAPVLEAGRDNETVYLPSTTSMRSANGCGPAAETNGGNGRAITDASSSPIAIANDDLARDAPQINANYFNNMKTGLAGQIKLPSQQTMRGDRVSAE